ncbi:MAG: pyridoxal phosphate-dependent aminotransferase [Campylobacterales bacterium]|nr:pyridoxal phosphate-dependent aminotransferase [Campylobacterales bacterium]
MIYDFSTSASREDSNAEKYKLRKELFGTDDVLPVWVADMDIDTPEFVLSSVQKRLNHPIVGYEEVPKSAFEAQRDWIKRHHYFEVDVEDIFYSPSVVASINLAIDAFTKEGDGVVVQTPVYPPFFHSVNEHSRKVIKNPLKYEDGRYTFDIDDLKSKIDDKTKLLLLCSPHNPVGRVWRVEELKEILEVCLKHNMVVFSDEIHCDLVYRPHKHTPFASLDGASDITITAMGVGKSFNMAGFGMSSIIIQNKSLKEKFLKSYKKVHFGQGCVLSHVAFESAYRYGDRWLEELKIHLQNNYKLLDALCKKYEKFIKLTQIEATYLAWLDCSAMGLGDRELREFFIKDAKLGLNAGLSFGREGSGFMRLNFGVSFDKMTQIIKRLEYALEQRMGI